MNWGFASLVIMKAGLDVECKESIDEDDDEVELKGTDRHD